MSTWRTCGTSVAGHGVLIKSPSVKKVFGVGSRTWTPPAPPSIVLPAGPNLEVTIFNEFAAE